jgi:hypothetical protein
MICSNAKQKCVGVVWARASGVSSGSAEIVAALTEMKEELANIREVVEDRSTVLPWSPSPSPKTGIWSWIRES